MITGRGIVILFGRMILIKIDHLGLEGFDGLQYRLAVLLRQLLVNQKTPYVLLRQRVCKVGGVRLTSSRKARVVGSIA